MAKGLKILIGLFLVLVVILLGAYIFSSIYFTPERLKTIVTPKLSKTLGREVTLKEIHLNLFKGLKINEFTVKERQGFLYKDFVYCDSLNLKFKLLPLLSKRIEIVTLVLNKPSIKIVRNKDNELNFRDILDQFKKAEKPESIEYKKSAPLALLISEVKIKDGEITFKDLQSNKKLHLSKLDFRADHIAFDRFFPLSLSAFVNEFPIEVKGKINPKILAMNLHLKGSGDNVSPLISFFSPTLKIVQGKADINCDVVSENLEKIAVKGKFSGQDFCLLLPSGQRIEHINPDIFFSTVWKGEEKKLILRNVKASFNKFLINIEGAAGKKYAQINFAIPSQSISQFSNLVDQFLSVKITHGKIKASGKIKTDNMINMAGRLNLDLSEASLEISSKNYDNLNLSASGRFNLNMPKSRWTVHTGKLNFNGTKLGFSGTISPEWINVRCKAPAIVLSDFQCFMPSSISDLKGIAGLNLALKGNLSKLSYLVSDGEIFIRQLGCSLNNQPAASNWNGKILFSGHNATIPSMKGKVSDAVFKFNGKVLHFLSRPNFNIDMRADNVDVEKMLNLLSNSSKETAKKKTSAKAKTINLPFSTNGKIVFNHLFYKKAAFSSLNAQHNLHKNVLSLKSIQGRFQRGGALKANVETDLGKRNIAYNVNLQLNRVGMDNFSEILISPHLGKIKGKSALDTQMRGRGFAFSDLEKYLNGRANLFLTDGEFSGNSVLQSIATFLDINALANPKFKTFNGDFKVKDGKINVNGKANGKDFNMSLNGQTTTMGKLDLHTLLVLSKDLVHSSKVKRVFAVVPKDNAGNYLVPLLIKGDIKSPKVKLDVKTVEEIFKQKAKEKLEEILQKNLPLKDIPFFR